jgi:maltodextrin utilization protein YvdJ
LVVADKALFRNCLVIMRPKTTKNDLPSTHDVSVYIHNRFVDQLKLLKKEILVSTTFMIFKFYSQILAGGAW